MARDEFCYEEGMVSFDGVTPIYTPDKVYTVDRVYDLEKSFSDYAEWVMTENNIETVDELIEYNGTLYVRGK